MFIVRCARTANAQYTPIPQWLSGNFFKGKVMEGMQIRIKCTHACMLAKLLQSCPALCYPMNYSPQAPLSMGFPRQEYRSGLPCPPPGDLPKPGLKPLSLKSPALAGQFCCCCCQPSVVKMGSLPSSNHHSALQWVLYQRHLRNPNQDNNGT